MLNNGLFLADLPEGIINADQLHEALPHPMHLIKVTLKGSDMSRLIREMEKSSISAEISDSRDGLPRENFGELCYDGIRFEPNSQTVFGKETYSARAEVYADNSGSLSICSVFPND